MPIAQFLMKIAQKHNKQTTSNVGGIFRVGWVMPIQQFIYFLALWEFDTGRVDCIENQFIHYSLNFMWKRCSSLKINIRWPIILLEVFNYTPDEYMQEMYDFYSN